MKNNFYFFFKKKGKKRGQKQRGEKKGRKKGVLLVIRRTINSKREHIKKNKWNGLANRGVKSRSYSTVTASKVKKKK